MTAEIGILNKHAVALAADSAVTINSGKGRKIYNSVNKLFTLSKYEPVGIMIYGNADLLGVPWETIIKTYRKKLGRKKHDTIEKYAESFIAFLKENIAIFPEEEQHRYFNAVVGVVFRSIIRELKKTTKTDIEEDGKISDSEVKRKLKEVIFLHFNQISTLPENKSLSQGFKRSFSSSFKLQIDRVIRAIFEKLPIDENSRKKLHEIAKYTFTKEVFFGHSGIVIAGFGEKEMFPALRAVKIDGIIRNEIRYTFSEESSSKIEHTNRGVIIPFAQREMVDSFIRGMHPKISKTIDGYLQTIFSKYHDLLFEHIKKHIDEGQMKSIGDIRFLSKGIIDDFKSSVIEYQNENHINPIVSSVSFLPKEELAVMAETLVNLSLFKQKISVHSDETVGGAIDVAVISKGDGFIWIKRKHYFDPKLNAAFFHNYRQEVANE